MRYKKSPDVILLGMVSTKIDPLISWRPDSLDEIYFDLNINIGLDDGSEGVHFFYVEVATPEALRCHHDQFLISSNRMIIIDDYDYFALKQVIEDIIKKSKRRHWEDTCIALTRYFNWEYEDYGNRGY